jgi:hypothetical protein
MVLLCCCCCRLGLVLGSGKSSTGMTEPRTHKSDYMFSPFSVTQESCTFQWSSPATRVIGVDRVQLANGSVLQLDSTDKCPRTAAKGHTGGHILLADYDPSLPTMMMRVFPTSDADCTGNPEYTSTVELNRCYTTGSTSYLYASCTIDASFVIHRFKSDICSGSYIVETHPLSCVHLVNGQHADYQCHNVTGRGKIQSFVASWTVPAAPSDPLALVYLWNGVLPRELDATGHQMWVMQPVLIFGFGACSKTPGWSLISFLQIGVENTANTTHCGPEVQVEEGDQITGSIIRSENGDWVVEGRVSGKTAVTQITVAAAFFDEMKTAPTTAIVDMEMYRFKECSGYPNSQTRFNSMAISVMSSQGIDEHVNPVWSTSVYHHGEDDGGNCSQNITVQDPQTIVLNYVSSGSPVTTSQYQQFSCSDSLCSVCGPARSYDVGTTTCIDGVPFSYQSLGCGDGFIDFRLFNDSKCQFFSQEFRQQQCVASGSNFTKYVCTGATTTLCELALTRLCSDARRSSIDKCQACSMAHQHEVLLAGCNSHNVDTFCAAPIPGATYCYPNSNPPQMCPPFHGNPPTACPKCKIPACRCPGPGD